MRAPLALVMFLILSLFATAAPVEAGGIDPGAVRRWGRIFYFVEVIDYLANPSGRHEEMNRAWSGLKKCRADGYSEQLCRSTFQYCVLSGLPLPGTVVPFFLELYQFNQTFSVNCGDGTCFQCCFVPTSGCHSSFLGFPVINCNEGYGPGTRGVGNTLIDPGVPPGQACITTPQTCDHIGMCLSARSASEIGAINANPNHVIHSAAASDARARSFAEWVHTDWASVLDDFHTSSPLPSDDIRLQRPTLSAVGDFVTGRGCLGWREGVPLGFGTDWSAEPYRIVDGGGNVAPGPSHLNGIRQLGSLRALASVPNGKARLDFIGSRVWTPEAIDQYLQGVTDPDAILIRAMSPLALELLQRNPTLPDYRMLAVPLPGEQAQPDRYNGCTLGSSPEPLLARRLEGSHGVELEIAAAGSPEPVAALVFWGDGSASPLSLAARGGAATVSHQYADGGRYQVLVVLQGSSGLRTLAGTVVETASSGPGPGAPPIPVITEIQVVDLVGRIDSFSGNPFQMVFQLETSTPTVPRYDLGVSTAPTVPLETTVSFGTVAGWNLPALPLRHLRVRPRRFGDGNLVGFQRTYFAASHLRVGVLGTKDGGLSFVDVPLSPERVLRYPVGSDTAVPLGAPTYDAQGRLIIPFEQGGVRYDRVDFVLPESAFQQLVQPPIDDPEWTGFEGTMKELRPDRLPSTDLFADGFEVGHLGFWSVVSP